MTNKRIVLLVCLIVVGAASWMIFRGRDPLDPLAVLDNPDRMILYSIDGDAVRHDRTVEGADLFHRAPVIGQVNVIAADKRSALAYALKQGIESPERPVECFWPRHALRVTSNGRTVDYLICFECSRIYVYEGNSKVVKHVSRAPQRIFNQHLREAGITLSKGMAPDPQ